MSNARIDFESRWIQLLAWSEVVGGAALAFVLIMSPGPDTIIPSVSAFFGITFGALTFAGGLLLLEKDARGVPLSLLSQTFQTIAVSSGGRFVAIAGLKAWTVLATTGAGVHIGIGSEFVFGTRGADGTLAAQGFLFQSSYTYAVHPLAESSLTVAINFAALYFVVRLGQLWFGDDEARGQQER